MKNYYVLRKEVEDGRQFYLMPGVGFCSEGVNGGVYRFTSKKTANDLKQYANKHMWSHGKGKDILMTYDEYLQDLSHRLDKKEAYANRCGLCTHREAYELYVYLCSEQYGKPVNIWHNVTYESESRIETYGNEKNRI